ncbi:glutathione S-transferase theta-3-like [Eucyclogobius newberryi]|uniref:glutathione S-transferase theta-3-like n=1 Tax=Eucyclogobius newberryi TaxID=166745 RepID=UPI003B5C9406
MELYLDLCSQPCRSVFLVAKALNVPFEFKHVDLAAGQHYTEEFGKISSMRKVPVMKDGDFILTESTAILDYMVQKHKGPDHWFPSELQSRARVNEYLSWQHTNLRANGSKVFLLRLVFPMMMGSEAPKEKMDAAMEELNTSLSLLENYFLRDKPFIIGDKVSVADIVAVAEIMQPVGTGVDVFAGRPKLSAWRDRVKGHLGEELFKEANEVIMRITELPQHMDKTALEMMKPKYQKMFS